MKPTKVIFRKWPDGSILALFPELPWDAIGMHCTSYEHVGQHGGTSYTGCIQATVPATDDESASLRMELEHIGYTLKVCKRK